MMILARAAAAIATAGVAATLLAACESAKSSYELKTGSSIAHVAETRVFVSGRGYGSGDCVFAPQLPLAAKSLQALAIPALVTTGIEALKKAIDSAAKADEAKVTAYLNFVSRGKDFPRCVAIISGRFLPMEATQADALLGGEPDWFRAYPHGQGADPWPAFKKMLVAQSVVLVGKPDLLFEAYVIKGERPAGPGTAAVQFARFVPTFFAFHEPPESHQTIFRPNPVSDVSVELILKSPNNDKDVAKSMIGLGLVQRGQTILLNYDELNTWQGCEAAKAEAVLSAVTMAVPARCNDDVAPFMKESPWAGFAFPDKNQPVVLIATVSEKRQPNAFLEFMSNAIGASKTDVSNALNNALIPEKREAANNAAEAARLKALGEYKTQLSATIKALQSCIAATEPGQIKTSIMDARIAEQSLNAAANALDAGATSRFTALTREKSECSSHLDEALKLVLP